LCRAIGGAYTATSELAHRACVARVRQKLRFACKQADD
jgi:hypothetical protein